MPIPVLKVNKFLVDAVDVHLAPQDVIVAIDAINDIVVEAIELLKEVELLPGLHQRRVIRYRETK